MAVQAFFNELHQKSDQVTRRNVQGDNFVTSLVATYRRRREVIVGKGQIEYYMHMYKFLQAFSPSWKWVIA